MRRIMNLTLIFIGVFFISCTKKEEPNTKALNLYIPQKVKGMDPIYANDLYSSGELARVYEGLLEYNYVRPYELRANLAESMPEVSNNGLNYTFKIRQGVLFHDDPAFPDGKGRELVAQDFVYSIKRLADLKLQGLGWWLFDGKIKGLNEWRDKYREAEKSNYDDEVEGLKATSKYTLQLVLTKPFPQLLYALAMPFSFAVAKEVVDHYGQEFLNHPVGTGAFMLDRFDQSNKIVYQKNPNFREKTFPCDAFPEYKSVADVYCDKKIPFVDKVTVNVILEDQPRWLNFQKGNLDLVSIPKDNFDSVIPDAKELAAEFKEKEISLIIAPSLDVTYTGFNHDLPLFQKKKLRQAMMLAYDSERANKLFYNATAIDAHSIIPPGIDGHIKGFKSPYSHQGSESIEKAKRLLREAGHPDARGIGELTLDVPSSTVSRQMAEYFKTQMEAINIKIKVVQNTWPEFQKKIRARQIQLYSIAWLADYPDAENFLQLLYGPNKSPGANGSGYDNAEFNALYEQSSTMGNSSARTKLYEQMSLMAAEEVPLLFGVHRQKYVLTHSWITNYIVSDFSLGNSQYVDIDINKKRETMKKL